jgi:diguanylate cyclase (GGDEF)-like protein
MMVRCFVVTLGGATAVPAPRLGRYPSIDLDGQWCICRAKVRGMKTFADNGVVLREDLSDVLGEFARTMVTDFPIQGILDHLVKRIVEILPVTAAGVTLISPGLEPQYVAASDPSALRYEKLQTELGEGPCLEAFHTGHAVAVADLRREDRFPAFVPRALESGLAAVFTFPLLHKSLQLGALDLYRDSPGAMSEETMDAAQTLADVATAYLTNAQARSDLQDSSDQSREAALHDPLTGLPNRVLILELLEHAFRGGRRTGRHSAVLFLDLDGFKQITDTHGHQVGDQLLIAVSERLTSVLRPGDSLARLSGDEFVILCENLTDTAEADPIAVRLSAALSQPFTLAEVDVTVSASIGIAFTGEVSDDPEELLREADLAMYRAKRSRTGTVAVLDLRELHLAGHQAGLARSLPGALKRGEMHIDYQPIVEAQDGRIIGAEALLRWTHPSRGAVSPTVFIPFAEQSGQITNLGQWVLAQAWSDRSLWREHGSPELGISVNVSAHQFMSAGFADAISRVLQSDPGAPGLLTLEITESVFVRDEERALIVLSELKQLGVSLALDDFGTGYSSLGYLEALPIDVLKIDQQFIANLGIKPSNEVIVNAIIQLAHGLGMTVVSEGVETIRQRDEVVRLGSDSSQGFYFARPMLASSFDALVRREADGDSSSRPALPIPGHASCCAAPVMRRLR